MKQKIFILSLIVLFLAFSIKAIPSYKETYFSCNTIFSTECIHKYYTSMNKTPQLKINKGGIVIGGDEIISKESVEYSIKKKIDENNNLNLFEKLTNKDFLDKILKIN